MTHIFYHVMMAKKRRIKQEGKQAESAVGDWAMARQASA